MDGADDAHGLTGDELFTIAGVKEVLNNFTPGKMVKVQATKPDDTLVRFDAIVRIDTPQEVQYYQHGGILQYVLRQLQSKPGAAKA